MESPDLEKTIIWEDDPENPINWPDRRKWLVTLVACFTAFVVGWNALSISSAATVINERFGISDAHFPNSFWTVTSWNVGAGLFPLAGLPVLEDFGFRKGYLISYALFTLFVIPQAVAQSYATLIITRFFAGGFGSIVMNAIENIIADIWPGVSNCRPATLYMVVYLCGFTIGPVIGSAILTALSWRWIFYIQLIVYCALFPLLFVFIRETRGSVILRGRSKRGQHLSREDTNTSRRSTTDPMAMLRVSLIRPAQLFFTEPVVFFFTLWCSFSIGFIFLATQSIAQVYTTNYGFTEIQCGYVQVALLAGELLGIPICLAQDHYYLRTRFPEARLPYSIPASFVGLSGGLFLYAWTSYSWIHWMIPTVGLVLVGIGILVVSTSVVTYLTDAYGLYAASTIAAVAAVENMFSGFLPLAAQSMYTRLGFQWASTLIAFLALALSFAPVVLWFKGPAIREKSRFMTSGLNKSPDVALEE